MSGVFSPTVFSPTVFDTGTPAATGGSPRKRPIFIETAEDGEDEAVTALLLTDD